MFKRKRLFERGDTYRDTGIPCGNPKRVQTGEVLCMPNASATMGPSSSAPLADLMETQGEEQLRLMAQKQLKTDMTMHELQSQHRRFTEAGQYKPVIKEIKGVMRLPEYKDLARGDERVETLRQCGLTEDEIRLQIGREEMENGQTSVRKSKCTYGAQPDIQQDQLRAIDSKIKEKEASLATPDTVRGLKEISRQEMDIEISMFWGTSRDSNVLTNLLTEKKSGVTGDPNDPINHLPQLMADIEERAQEKIKEKRRRRRRNRKQRNNNDVLETSVGDKIHEDDSEEEPDRCIGCLTFEEMTALKESEKNAANFKANTNTTCVSESSGLVSSKSCSSGLDNKCDESKSNLNPACTNDRECVPNEKTVTVSGSSAQSDRKVLKGPIEFLPVKYIKDNRLSLEQIRKLPKFMNYEAGSPNNVLFVKNLSPHCSERDLVSLFGQFEKAAESQIVYRLMTGRMRGQAFVSFHDTDVATEAMRLVNGFMLHGKPIIIQYGRRTSA